MHDESLFAMGNPWLVLNRELRLDAWEELGGSYTGLPRIDSQGLCKGMLISVVLFQYGGLCVRLFGRIATILLYFF